VAPKQASHLFAGQFNRLLRLAAEGVRPAGRVAEMLGKVRQHRFKHARIDPRVALLSM